MNLFPITYAKTGRVYLINLDLVTVIDVGKNALTFKFAGGEGHSFTGNQVDAWQKLVDDLMKLVHAE